MKLDLVGVVEAAYYPHASDQSFVDGIATAIKPFLDCGQGMIGVMVDATHAVPGPPEVLAFCGAFATAETIRAAEALQESSATETRRTQFLSCGPVSTLSRALGHDTVAGMDDLADAGIGDSVFIMAGNPYRRLCVFSSPRRQRTKLPRHQLFAFEHVAAHVSAALALRFRGAAPSLDAADAIFGPDGRIHHARGMAKQESQLGAIRRSVLAAERARGPLRRRDGERALASWRARVQARWSIAERVESDSKRYVAAFANSPWVPRPLLLTRREWEVGLLAAQGHSNKLIAYELGVAEGTVATHLARLTAKLGIRRRVDLVRALAPPRATHAPAPAKWSGLTTAEAAVASLIVRGKTNAEIAKERGTSPLTIANQVTAILRKLNARSRTDLIAGWVNRSLDG